MPTHDQVVDAIDRYAAAVSSADKAAILSCFAEQASFVDPYPSPPRVGRADIGEFWDVVFAMGKPLAFVPERIAVCSDRCAFNFAVTLATPDGGRVGIEGIEVATIGDDGLIAEMTAYWDPATIHPLPAD